MSTAIVGQHSLLDRSMEVNHSEVCSFIQALVNKTKNVHAITCNVSKLEATAKTTIASLDQSVTKLAFLVFNETSSHYQTVCVDLKDKQIYFYDTSQNAQDSLLLSDKISDLTEIFFKKATSVSGSFFAPIENQIESKNSSSFSLLFIDKFLTENVTKQDFYNFCLLTKDSCYEKLQEVVKKSTPSPQYASLLEKGKRCINWQIQNLISEIIYKECPNEALFLNFNLEGDNHSLKSFIEKEQKHPQQTSDHKQIAALVYNDKAQHFLGLYISLENKRIYLYDPMNQNTELGLSDNELDKLTKCFFNANERSSVRTFSIIAPHHQNDGVNCGRYTTIFLYKALTADNLHESLTTFEEERLPAQRIFEETTKLTTTYPFTRKKTKPPTPPAPPSPTENDLDDVITID